MTAHSKRRETDYRREYERICEGRNQYGGKGNFEIKRNNNSPIDECLPVFRKEREKGNRKEYKRTCGGKEF
jgi:hypothetical protein